MVSVRCMVPGWFAGKSITQKRVPLGGGAVPRMRAPISSIFSPMPMSTGMRSLHQMSVDLPPPGRRDDLALVAKSSISTLATPFASWPVMTRRIGGGEASLIGWSLLLKPAGDEIGGALGDHDRRRVGVAAGDGRHHRGVGDAQPVNAFEFELRIDDGIGIVAHAAGAGGMKHRLRVLPHEIAQGLVLVRHVVAGQILAD